MLQNLEDMRRQKEDIDLAEQSTVFECGYVLLTSYFSYLLAMRRSIFHLIGFLPGQSREVSLQREMLSERRMDMKVLVFHLIKLGNMTLTRPDHADGWQST